jgi:hypothetical protein
MLFSSPEIQRISDAKTNHQLVAAEKRLNEITGKLSKASVSQPNDTAKHRKNWDWAKSYESWSQWDDVEQLNLSKAAEEARVAGILNKQDSLGHYHDHGKEREFYELPETDKMKHCEDNRVMGNYLFMEGAYNRAAEHYKIALAYYEYCFPEDSSIQAELDELRNACLCNVALCYQLLGHLRESVVAASTVLKEMEGCHGKALFRRAQAYRLLDEYE